MSFAILRTAKLKTIGNIGGSLSHNYRTRETPNADPDLSVLNEHSLENSEAVKNAINARLPEKRRSDAVLCIEHLITASPEWEGWNTDQETAFFEKSKEWLKNKYGSENVISTTIHRDEKSPHLVAYVVPLDEETGRLNCKKWLGGRAKLSSMQTDFAQEVKEFGLERGVEGSKATHTTIKDYYAKLNKAENSPSIDLKMPDFPKTDLFESKEKYANRVADTVVNSIFEQIKFEWDRMSILSAEALTARKELLETKETLARLVETTKPYLEATSGLWAHEDGMFFFNSNLMRVREYADDKIAAKRKQLKAEEKKEIDRIFELRWNATLNHMNKEQMESYVYMRDSVLRSNADDDVMLNINLRSMQEKIIKNPDYAVNDYHWKAKKRREKEQTYKREEPKVLRNNNERGMDFDF